jgi:virginiamycin B lyase
LTKKISGKNFASNRKIIIYALIGIIAVGAISSLLYSAYTGRQDTSTSTPISSSLSNQVVESKKAAIEKFQEQFCGLDSKPNSNEYVTEIKLPKTCEMPLGIAVDTNSSKIWYVSTKNGSLGSYDLKEQNFDEEQIIPTWKGRDNPIESSQVWTVKLDKKDGVWFTDEKQNSLWRYNKSSTNFELYKIPGESKSFGTTYPVSMDFDSNGNVYFVGIRSPSLWYGNITEMTNNTSEGISEIPIPLEGFKGIDPDVISTGSVAVDSKEEVIWISMLAFAKKGQIFRYNSANHTFDVFDLPQEINSPVGIALDNSSNLWITDHGTSLFFRFSPRDRNITEFVTSKASERIFGGDESSSEGAYTLPYWIYGTDDGSLWFNEHTGNKIAHFIPSNSTLIEYWVPSQNKLFSQCSSENAVPCGIANVIQLSVGNINSSNTGISGQKKDSNNTQVWFTEWSENKIGRIATEKNLPFSVSASPSEVTIKKGDSVSINLFIKPSSSSSSSSSASSSASSGVVNMTASAAFNPTGGFGNSTWSFSEETISIKDGKTKKVSFIVTPSGDLKPGKYVIMLGAENSDVSYMKAISINVI